MATQKYHLAETSFLSTKADVKIDLKENSYNSKVKTFEQLDLYNLFPFTINMAEALDIGKVPSGNQGANQTTGWVIYHSAHFF